MTRLPRVFSVLLAFSIAATAAAERRILLHTSFADSRKQQRQPKPKRARMIEPDFAALDAPSLRRNERKKLARKLTAALFDDTVLHIDVEDVERNAVDAYVWSGRIDGHEGGSATIVVKDQTMVATFWSGTRKYMIEPVENGGHEALELDPAAFPDEAEPLRPEAPPATATTAFDTVVTADTGSTIDVLVAYTDDVRAALGGTSAAQAAASSAIAATNTAYANSGVVPRVRLVGTSEVAYAESGDLSVALGDVTEDGDGQMDSVHALRNQLGADAVALMVLDGGPGCGLAWILTSSFISNPGFSFAANAFSVTDYNCAVGNLSFPHELGHNFGLAHDRFVSPSATPSYPYAFGYVDTQGRFRDVMAYANACGGCPRVQYFSSPNLTYLDRPLGVSYESSPSTSADNVRALNNNASLIANWRQTVTYVPAVFTDDPLVARVTPVKALHVNQVRTAINAYRTAAQLPAFAWSATIGAGAVPTAAHVDELRTALTPALTAFGRTATYTPLAVRGTIQALHIQELRNYLK